nr:hypothetical protein [Enterococcus hirae]
MFTISLIGLAVSMLKHDKKK